MSQQDTDRNVWKMAHNGLELAGSAVLFGAVGWWIDHRYGTKPWGMMVGGIVGFTGGMYLFVKEALAANRKAVQQYRKDHQPQPPTATHAKAKTTESTDENNA